MRKAIFCFMALLFAGAIASLLASALLAVGALPRWYRLIARRTLQSCNSDAVGAA
jgi:hypothetical protein